MKDKPLLVIINGLPGSGKTTLGKWLAVEARLPHFSRDGIYETLYDSLDCRMAGIPPQLGAASFAFLYSVAGNLLAAGQSLVVEGFFGKPELRTAEFLQLQQKHDFKPIQILCQADGQVLLERYLTRAGRADRHEGHQDLEWLEHNRERLLQGMLPPLTLDGPIVNLDTTDPGSIDYAAVLEVIREFQNDGTD
ncbi:AAA family ATPase [Paenibacillus radicis (ex Xue et al. 2023)]|uniref:AAA family ATPase n=1 Tax=Paenibacillus radicis (ex Xue et al. 2023) TaxID=2972489 RepID=A0ABT1YB28_9BACL|nr:AAA family ATPase [Paenibacillus radicis (ex Xue et al. 2023)]MCR8630398.1 AAA family ATPase [Paenibacillus radicis (ex Xue et al. 2023)]